MSDVRDLAESGGFGKAVQWVNDKYRARRELREKIHRAHAGYITEGMTYGQSMDRCMERFGGEYQKQLSCPLTERVFGNIVTRTMGATMDSLTEATILLQLSKAASNRDALQEALDAQLDRYDERGDEELVTVEAEETTGGKFEGSKEKKVPVWKHKLWLMSQKIEVDSKFVDQIRALKPEKSINIFQKGGDITLVEDQALDAQLEKFSRHHTGLKPEDEVK